MIDNIEVYLKGDNISHDKTIPTIATIEDVTSYEDIDPRTKQIVKRWKIYLKVDNLKMTYTPNKTSMRNLMIALGPEESLWKGETISLYAKEQLIDNATHWVVIAE